MSGRRVRLRVAVAAAIVAAAATGTIIGTGALAGGGPRGGAAAIPPDEAYLAPAAVASAWARSAGHARQHQQYSPTRPAPVPSVTLPPGVPASVPPSAAAPMPALEAATSPLYGPILVNPAGMTVYRAVGGCACAAGYSPLLTRHGQPLTLPVMINGKIGTVTRADGTLQVTFDGWPLYLYSGDTVQGDTNGGDAHWRVIPVS